MDMAQQKNRKELPGHRTRRSVIASMVLFGAFCLVQCVTAQEEDRSPTTPHKRRLPVVAIQTDNQAVVNRTRIRAPFLVRDSSAGVGNHDFPPDYEGWAEISVRGNSSYFLNRKSYRLEVQNNDGSDRREPLLGMPADSDWVLSASVTDKTFVRNVLAHELWRQMGRYAVRWRFVELFMVTNALEGVEGRTNGVVGNPLTPALSPAVGTTELGTGVLASGNYQGVYVLMEKVKRGKGRLDITKMGPGANQEPEIGGGYIFKSLSENPVGSSGKRPDGEA